MSENKKKKLLKLIEKDLSAPWWRRRYDFLGIVGQLLRIRWIQSPWAKYCSERVAGYLRKVLKMAIPVRRTPSEINAIFKKHQRMIIYGYYFSD